MSIKIQHYTIRLTPFQMESKGLIDTEKVQRMKKRIKRGRQNASSLQLICDYYLLFNIQINEPISEASYHRNINSTLMSKLTKPHFVKVSSLVDARSGYNVYVKVVETEVSKSNDGQNNFVRAVVADETGAANAFFKGETAALIKEGATLAIRNGTIKLIKGHISLEIDIFGRVTAEKVEIKENVKNNISEKEVERRRKPRRDREDREDRPPRRDREDREERPRRREDREDRPPRREREDREDRPPRREREDKPPRRDREDREDRPPRRDREDRPKREDREDRPPRRDREDRPPRRDREDRPPRGDREDRGPRREDRPRREDDRPRREWTKIGAIEPGDDELNIIAKVISVERVGKKARVILGDETGVVKGFIYDSEELTVGNTVALFNIVAEVVKEHIEVQFMRRGRVDAARREIKDVNDTNDISAKEWIEAA